MTALVRRIVTPQVIKERAGIPQLSLSDRVRAAEAFARQAWRLVCAHSEVYADALGMSEYEITTLEDLGGVVYVETVSYGIVKLVPKYTCAVPYGDTWRLVLQARTTHRPSNGIGGGTTFIAALTNEEHAQVLEAIQEGRTYLQEERVWP